jgi:hypothetical protein
MTRRPVRRLGVILGMLALLLQMGVPLAHDPVGLGALAPWLGLPLCHAGGDSTADHGPAAPAPGTSALCPICFGLAAGAALIAPPAAGGIVVAALPQMPLPPASDTAPDRRVRSGPAQPRAPPGFA